MKVINRIKASDDFALAIKKGRAQRNQSFRVGISVSSKLGNAVVRNLVKRQIRSMCDSLIDYNSQSFDIVIIAKANFLNRSYDDNKQSLQELLKF